MSHALVKQITKDVPYTQIQQARYLAISYYLDLIPDPAKQSKTAG
jgi:hypothetical protein